MSFERFGDLAWLVVMSGPLIGLWLSLVPVAGMVIERWDAVFRVRPHEVVSRLDRATRFIAAVGLSWLLVALGMVCWGVSWVLWFR